MVICMCRVTLLVPVDESKMHAGVIVIVGTEVVARFGDTVCTFQASVVLS
jgi:hypothetical protein